MNNYAISHVCLSPCSRPGSRLAAIAAVLLGFGLWLPDAGAQTTEAPGLASPEQRITDSVIDADYKTYEAQQAEIRRLNNTGKFPLSSYALAKSQCWLDVSFHEYTRNDRSAFPQEALTQSALITRELSRDGQSPSAQQTPLVNKAARLREDLWQRLAELKKSTGFSCVQQQVACAEVELVHAGNEQNQQLGGNSWRHAKPYIQMAEGLVGDASEAAKACNAAAAQVGAPAAVAPAPANPVAKQMSPVEYSANVLFNFDKRVIGEARKLTLERLDQLIENIKAGKFTVKSIRLIGHADRTTFKGQPTYNDKLSADRADAVRQYMVSKGIKPESIQSTSRSAAEQVEACARPTSSKAELHECLLPNRRVEVVVQGER